MMASKFCRLLDDDRCASCGRNRELVTHEIGEVCRRCATDANRRRAAR